MKSNPVGIKGSYTSLKSIAFATCVCGISTGLADAAITAASGNAQGLNVSLAIAALTLNVSSASVAGSTPGNFNPSDSVASVTGGGLQVASVNTGVVNASTTYAGGNSVTSSSSVVDLELATLVSLLSITTAGTNSTIGSTATVSGDYNAFTTSGTSTLEGITINLNLVGAPASVVVAANSAPNTVVLNVPGVITIIANEQITGGDGVSTRSLEVNALRITLLDSQVLGGSIVVGHSFASLTAVPEPSYGIAALVPVLAFALRRTRRK